MVLTQGKLVVCHSFDKNILTMEKLGNKLKEIRIRKGYSQEELADLSNVSLRTIQRIEQNQNEPRVNTLHLICNALNVNIEDILDYGKEEKSDFMFYFHLSVLSFMVLPLGNIIVPLILWLNNKTKVVGLEKIGKSVIYFQIIITILLCLFFGLFIFTKILKQSDGLIYFYIAAFLYISNIAFTIINAVKAKKNKSPNRFMGVIHQF